MGWITSALTLAAVLAAASATYDEHDYHRTFREAKNQVGPKEELEKEYWLKNGQKILKDQLAKTAILKPAKNVIFFIGDGMSLATLAAARTHAGQRNGRPGEEQMLSFEKFPITGLSHTYCVNSQVADSACSATAYLGGVKANDATIGVSAAVPNKDCEQQLVSKNHVKSIAHHAQDSGLATGIVTTTRVTHASPAGTFAHTAERNWEADADVADDGVDPTRCTDIAHQLIRDLPGRDFRVIFGGGRPNFFGNTTISENATSELANMTDTVGRRLDGADLVSVWKEDKTKRNFTSKYVTNTAELNSIGDDTDFVLGLFNDNHLDYHLLAPESQPTLKQMTEAAIKILSKNEKGYFLFVEGGRIDHAHHATYARLALDETLELSAAVEAAVNLTSVEDTLIVVSSDHSHTMTISGYPSRGNDILGASDTWPGLDELPYLTLSYANGLGYRKEVDGFRADVTKEKEFIEKRPTFRYPGTVPLESETHGGEDVAVFARGPHQQLFTGSYEQSALPHLMAYALCVGSPDNACSGADLTRPSLLLLALAALLLATK